MDAVGAGRTDTWSLSEAIEALAGWNVGPMRAWLEERLCTDPVGVDVDDFAALETAAWWNAQDGSEPSAVAHRILDAASAAPDAIGPLLLYFRFVGMAAWEQSWTVDGILGLIAGATDWVDHWHATNPTAPAEIDPTRDLLDFLATEIDVFAVGIAGELSDWAKAARRAADRALTIRRSLADVPHPCLAHVRGCLDREADYYDMVAAAAQAVAAVRPGAPVSPVALDEAIRRLETPPEGLDRADRSELRAHKMSLKALRSKLAEEWLVVSSGRATMTFPFGVSGLPHVEVVSQVTQHGMDWTLAGLPVVSVANNLPISGGWDSSDPLDRAFRGAALRLPEIDLVTPGQGVRLRLRGSMWISELGNHLLRLDFPVVDADPVALYEMVRVASPEFAGGTSLGVEVRPIFDTLGSRTWESLGEFASDCVTSLVEQLGRPAGHEPVGHYAPQSFSVMVMVDSAAAWQPTTGAVRELENAQEVTTLFGSQIITGAVWSNLASVAQWAQVTPSTACIAMPSLGAFCATMTPNSAMIADFGNPSYTLDLLADCFLFTTSIDGLFGTWYDELARMNNRSKQTLSEIAPRMGAEDRPLSAEEVRAAEARPEDAQVQLHDFVVRCRSVLLFVESPTLVQFAPLRGLLNVLLESSGYSERKASFMESAEAMTEGRLESVLAGLRARIDADEHRVRAAADRRARLVVDALLAGVTVAGLSGLASLLQAGYQLGALPTDLLVVVVLLASIGIGIGVWQTNRRSS